MVMWPYDCWEERTCNLWWVLWLQWENASIGSARNRYVTSIHDPLQTAAYPAKLQLESTRGKQTMHFCITVLVTMNSLRRPAFIQNSKSTMVAVPADNYKWLIALWEILKGKWILMLLGVRHPIVYSMLGRDYLYATPIPSIGAWVK
jgi:hypothetical protein